MKNNLSSRSLLLLGIVAVILLAVLGLAYFFKNEAEEDSYREDDKVTPVPSTQATDQLEAPTQFEDSSAWPTYMNETYNYQVSYPKDWIIDNNEWMKNEKKPVDELLRFWNKADYTKDYFQPKLRADLAVFVIETIKTDPNNTLESLALQKDMPSDKETTTKLLAVKDVIIGGLSGKKFTFRNDFAQWSPIYLKKNNLIFHIQIDRGEGIDEQKFNEMVDKIITSIEFL